MKKIYEVVFERQGIKNIAVIKAKDEQTARMKFNKKYGYCTIISFEEKK